MTEEGVASLLDVWLTVRNLEGVGERSWGLSILKARRLAHANQVREFVLTDEGVQLLDVLAGPAGIIPASLPGPAASPSAGKKKPRPSYAHELARKTRKLERTRRTLEATITNLRTEFELVEKELRQRSGEAETANRRTTLVTNSAVSF